MNDWKRELLGFKKPLADLKEESPEVYSAMVLSTKHDIREIGSTLSGLEPAIAGGNLVRTIPLNSEKRFPRAQVYFSRGREVVSELKRISLGVEDVVRDIPPGLLPSFKFPANLSERDRSIALMTSMTYYTASTGIAAYHCVGTQCQESIDEWYSEAWSMRREPLEFSFNWLIGAGTHNPTDKIAHWHDKLIKEQRSAPDILCAYLCDDLVSSYLITIDILCYILCAERRRVARERKGLVEVPLRPKKMTQRVRKDVEVLREFFLYRHDPRVCRSKEGDPGAWLTEKEIAKHLKWLKKDARTPDQVRVCRRMTWIFGSNPSATYRGYFGDRNGGLRRLLQHLNAGPWRSALSRENQRRASRTPTIRSINLVSGGRLRHLSDEVDPPGFASGHHAE